MNAVLTSDKDGFLTGGSPVSEVRRASVSDATLFDIRTDVRAIRKAVQAGVSKTSAVMTGAGSKPINDPSYASISRMPARPTGRLKGDAGSLSPSSAAATKSGAASKDRTATPAAAGASSLNRPGFGGGPIL